MGLKKFEIVLDSPIWYSGQNIRGKLLVDTEKPLKMRGIRLNYSGKGTVRWSEGSGKNRRTYTNRETYLDLQQLVCGSYDDESELAEGQYVFVFNCDLPATSPCSFEGDYGRVKYSIKATMDLPWKIDPVVKQSLTVVSIMDLNHHPVAAAPVSEQSSKTFWGQSGPLFMSFDLPIRGYVAGQMIPMKIFMNNESEVEVKRISAELHQAELYKTGGGKFIKKLDEDGERLISLMRTQFQPDKNVFDSATAYHDTNVGKEIQTNNSVEDSTDVHTADAEIRSRSSSFPSSSTEACEVHHEPKSANHDHRPQPSRERRGRRIAPNIVYDKLIRLTNDKSDKIQVQSTYESKKLDLLVIERKIKEDNAKQNTELHELAKLKLNLEIEGIKNAQKYASELFQLQKNKYLIEMRVQENHLESQLAKMQSTDEKI